ncbi:hypothetical protein BH18ACT1_BH18ACT1_15390 [soil metagenome]
MMPALGIVLAVDTTEAERFSGEPLPGWVLIAAGLAVLVVVVLVGLLLRRAARSQVERPTAG